MRLCVCWSRRSLWRHTEKIYGCFLGLQICLQISSEVIQWLVHCCIDNLALLNGQNMQKQQPQSISCLMNHITLVNEIALLFLLS